MVLLRNASLAVCEIYWWICRARGAVQGLLEHEDTPVMEYQQQTVDLRRRRGSTASHATIASDRDGEGPQSNCYGRSARYLTKCPGKAWVPTNNRFACLSVCACCFLFICCLDSLDHVVCVMALVLTWLM